MKLGLLDVVLQKLNILAKPADYELQTVIESLSNLLHYPFTYWDRFQIMDFPIQFVESDLLGVCIYCKVITMLNGDVEFEHLDCKKQFSTQETVGIQQCWNLGRHLNNNSCFQSNPQRTGGFHESTSKEWMVTKAVI